ncbi:hypothetical protein BH23PLA1_BH23PLA1_24420 [soil metagenome]
MIGQRLGSFLIEDKIGSGAMGEVYLARHVKSNRLAAVKVIAGEFLLRENALKRFTREAEILERLRHENIVRYYARGKFQGIFYYAMEFVQGRNLDNVIDERGYLPWREVIDLAIQLCNALQFAHEHEVIHRDRKPSNLMITSDNQVKLTDFGIAKDLEAEALTQTGRTLGTAAYMAPEQIRGNPPISHKTDLYALGCLLYQMLTGQPPFQGRSAVALMHAHMSESPPRPSFKNPDIPRALDDLVVKLMSKVGDDRPFDAAAVAHQLEQIRDRAERGKPIRMAFDGAPDPSAPSLAATMDGPSAPTSKSSRKKSRSKRDSQGPPVLTRQHVEFGLLVLALIGILAFVGYMFWPRSKEYLFHKAEQMMASTTRSDWVRAQEKYITPLREKYPDYQTEIVDQWLDKILVRTAEDRAVFLTGTNPMTNRSKNQAEELFKKAHEASSPSQERRQYALALEHWENFVAELEKRNDPEERGWLLFGQELVAEHRQRHQDQLEAAERALQRALQQWRESRTSLAVSQLEAILQDYQEAALGDPELMALVDQAADDLEEIQSQDSRTGSGSNR